MICIKRFFVFLVRTLSAIMPKNKRLWVFGCWQGKIYADNAKYLFEYMNEHHKEIQCVWITKNDRVVKEVRNKGYKCHHRNSIKGLWACLRAKFIFITAYIDDVSYFSRTQNVIELWHGMGIKDVSINNGWCREGGDKGISKYKEWLKKGYSGYRWMVASQEAKCKYMKSYFVPEENVYITGQPKDDAFVNVTKNDYVSEIREKHPGAKIAVYLPTHRNFGKTSEISDVMSIDALTKVNEKLVRENIVMIFKPHFHEFEKYKGYEKSMSNIIFATDKDKYGDVYTCCDMMVTDYSGIMFGYLASEKPIIYFTYDYDDYVSNDAGFCYDFNDITYGPVCKTWDEVVYNMSSIKAEDYSNYRNRLRERFCPYHDGQNCERVYETVTEISRKK